MVDWRLVLCLIGLGISIIFLLVLSMLNCRGTYGPREVIQWAVQRGWLTSWTSFDYYEGTHWTRKEFDQILSKAEHLGKVEGTNYLCRMINARFYGFGKYL